MTSIGAYEVHLKILQYEAIKGFLKNKKNDCLTGLIIKMGTSFK